VPVVRYARRMTEIKINRAPLLTLWASIVARCLGYDEDTAMTLGRAVSGLTAQSKGRRLGIYTSSSDEDRARVQAKRDEIGAETVALMDRIIPCARTPEGLRALQKASPIAPESVRKHLAGRFKENLQSIEAQLTTWAAAYDPEELNRVAMDVYMRLRPSVPKGREGWGKAGLLDTDTIDAAIRARQPDAVGR